MEEGTSLKVLVQFLIRTYPSSCGTWCLRLWKEEDSGGCLTALTCVCWMQGTKVCDATWAEETGKEAPAGRSPPLAWDEGRGGKRPHHLNWPQKSIQRLPNACREQQQ